MLTVCDLDVLLPTYRKGLERDVVKRSEIHPKEPVVGTARCMNTSLKLGFKFVILLPSTLETGRRRLEECSSDFYRVVVKVGA